MSSKQSLQKTSNDVEKSTKLVENLYSDDEHNVTPEMSVDGLPSNGHKKSSLRASVDSLKSLGLRMKSHVTLTVLAYGTDVEHGYSFEQDQILAEGQVFVPSDATYQTIEWIIHKHLKSTFPDYVGRATILVNPADVKTIIRKLHILGSNHQLDAVNNSPGCALRMVGRVYVLMLDPHDGLQACSGSIKGRTKSANSSRSSKSLDDSPPEPSTKRLKSIPSSESTRRQNLGSKNEDSSAKVSRELRSSTGSNQNLPPEHAATVGKRKRSVFEEAYLRVSQALDIPEACMSVQQAMSPRPIKRAVRSVVGLKDAGRSRNPSPRMN